MNDQPTGQLVPCTSRPLTGDLSCALGAGHEGSHRNYQGIAWDVGRDFQPPRRERGHSHTDDQPCSPDLCTGHPRWEEIRAERAATKTASSGAGDDLAATVARLEDEAFYREPTHLLEAALNAAGIDSRAEVSDHELVRRIADTWQGRRLIHLASTAAVRGDCGARDWTQTQAVIRCDLPTGHPGEHMHGSLAEVGCAWPATHYLEEAEDLTGAVFEALGAASVAWEGGARGVFRDDMARGLANELLDRIYRDADTLTEALR